MSPLDQISARISWLTEQIEHVQRYPENDLRQINANKLWLKNAQPRLFDLKEARKRKDASVLE